MKQIISFLLVLNATILFAVNNDTTLITIGDKKITIGEFKYLHDKNNQVVTEEENSIDEYLDMFINFKLKVLEAESMGMDTTTSFVKELTGYRDQLAAPYLKDQDLDDQLIQEAYNRLKEEVEASHILIKIKSDNPDDTLSAYNRAIEARNKILNGESFKEVAIEYSEDPSVSRNGGYLNFFSGFQMVLPFENAAFNTPVGEISMPFRSKFGYHILQVHSRRPAQGQISVSHILIMTNERMSEDIKEKKKIEAFDIYNRIKAGEDFSKLAKENSDDHNTGAKGGKIGYIRTGQTIPAFEKAAFALENEGDISEPIESRFGWHIIRLEEKKGLPTFEEEKENIKRRLARDERGTKAEKSFIDKLKKEYNFTVYQDNLDALYAAAKQKRLDSTLRADLELMKDTILTFGDTTKVQSDLAEFTWTHSPNGTNFESKLAAFEKVSLLDYEKSRLETKYPEFKYLVNEYHDGLLLFEISNQMVWSKASSDEEGLNKFHKKKKKNYTFDKPCFGGSIIYLKDSTTLVKYDSLLNIGLSLSTIKDSLNTEEILMRLDNGFYKEGDNSAVDYLKFDSGNSNFSNVFGIAKLDGQMYEKGDIKPLAATRGAVISDYQDYLEDKWIKSLRKKYKVEVNKDLLESIEE